MRGGRATARRAAAGRPRTATRAQLETELRELRERLAEAEATLHAIGNDDVDALVVRTRERGKAQVFTIGNAQAAYEHFVEAMREGALTLDEAGVVLHASRRMLQIAARDSLVGQSAEALFEDSHGLRTLLQNAGDEPMALGTTLRRGDGSFIPVDLSASVLPLPGPRRIGVVVSSSPTPSRMRRILRDGADEARVGTFDRVLAQLPIGIIIIDARSGHVVYANARAEEIFGRVLVGVDRPISHVELVCWRPDGTILEPEQLPAARVVHGELSVREELARARPDGTFVQTRTTATPILDEDGELESVLLAVEDASEDYIGRVEREANERFRELFIGVLGHDLRDPLSAIVAGAALLQRRGGLSPDQASTVDRIAGSADRMARMVDQILDFTRSRLGGGMPLRRKRVALPEVVRRVVNDLEVSHKGRRVETVFEGGALGEWDPDRLEQVVSNLVGNALAHGSAETPVRVRVAEAGSVARLEVHNDGSPIPEALLPHVFDPFRRAGVDRGRRGLGLGLFIAQQIVHAHGGTLTVDSSAERGTMFVVALPRVQG